MGDDKDTWEEVKDKASGQSYWWNLTTNETTALGAPKPEPGAPAGPHSAPHPADCLDCCTGVPDTTRGSDTASPLMFMLP
jgi:hypothetical protein